MSGVAVSERQRNRLLEEGSDACQELGALSAVEDSVVAGESDVHQLRGKDLPAPHRRFFPDRPNGEDACLGGVDDRGKVAYPEHPQVGDREGPTGELRRRDRALADLRRQCPGLDRDLAQALAVGIEDGGNDERALSSDGDAYVDPRIELEAPVPVAIGRFSISAGRTAARSLRALAGTPSRS